MSIPGFDEIEPRVLFTVTACGLVGALVGAVPGALMIYLDISEEALRLAIVSGVTIGAGIGTIASSTALMIAAYRGRRHRHSTAGTRYRTEAVGHSEAEAFD